MLHFQDQTAKPIKMKLGIKITEDLESIIGYIFFQKSSPIRLKYGMKKAVRVS